VDSVLVHGLAWVLAIDGVGPRPDLARIAMADTRLRHMLDVLVSRRSAQRTCALYLGYLGGGPVDNQELRRVAKHFRCYDRNVFAYYMSDERPLRRGSIRTTENRKTRAPRPWFVELRDETGRILGWTLTELGSTVAWGLFWWT
jgi:hypothetical protein